MSDAAEHWHSSAPAELSEPTAESASSAARERLNQTSYWGAERPRRVGLKGPLVLAIVASVGTAFYVRWRTRSRLSRLLRIIMIVRAARASVPTARATAPLGGPEPRRCSRQFSLRVPSRAETEAIANCSTIDSPHLRRLPNCGLSGRVHAILRWAWDSA